MSRRNKTTARFDANGKWPRGGFHLATTCPALD